MPISPRLGIILLLTATSSSCAAERKAAPVTATTTTVVRAATPDLLTRLRGERLHGYAVVRDDTRYFATAEKARAAKPKPKGDDDATNDAYVVRIADDDGGADRDGVVHVSTKFKDSRLETFDRDFALDLYIRREDIVPVLREPRVKGFPDGTAYVAREGMPVRIDRERGGGIVPAQPSLRTLPIDIRESDVALTFERKIIEPNKSKGEEETLLPSSAKVAGEIVCDGNALLDRASTPATFADRRCALLARSMPAMVNGELNPDSTGMLRIGGQAIMGTSTASHQRARGTFACDAPGLKVFRADGDDTFVLVDMQHATLRARVTSSMIGRPGGCGFAIGRPRIKIYVTRPEEAVYFAGGAAAGWVVRPKELPYTREVDGLICTTVAYVDVQLCFHPNSLDTKEERS